MRSKSKRLLIIKIVCVLFAAFLILIPTNLTSLPDADLRVLVTALGLDYTDDKYSVSGQILMPQTDGSMFVSAKGEGINIESAINQMENSIGKKVELELCTLVVMGKSLAQENAVKPLAYLMNSGLLSPGTALIFSDDAGVFIKETVTLSDKSGTELSSFIMSTKGKVYEPSITLLKYLSDLNSKSQASFLPIIKLKKEDEKPQSDTGTPKEEPTKQSIGNNSEFIKQTAGEKPGEPSGGVEEKATIESLYSAAVIKHSRYVGSLTDENSRGIKWLDKKADNGLINIKDFEFDGVEHGCPAARLKYKSVKLKPRFDGGMPVLKIKINVHLDLLNKSLLDIYSEDMGKVQAALKGAFIDTIKKDIEDSVAASKQMDADFLNIKTQFHRFRYKELRQYDDNNSNNFLENLRVEYDISCRVK